MKKYKLLIAILSGSRSNFKLEERILNLASFIVGVFSLVFSILLAAYGAKFELTLTVFCSAWVNATIYTLSRIYHRFKWGRTLLTAGGFSLLSLLYIFNSGIEGIAIYLFASFFVLLTSVYNYKLYPLFAFAVGLNVVLLYILQITQAELMHNLEDAKLTTLSKVLGLIASFSAIATILKIIRKEHSYNIKKIIIQHKELSEQKKHIEEAKEEALIATASKSEFLSTMSHELRTPLNGVIGITNLLLEEKPLDSQIDKLNLLKFSSENLLCIINDILDYSKIEAGKISLEKVEFRLINLVKSVTESLRVRAEEKGIFLRAKLDTHLPDTILGDPTRLTQILNNLVGNAIKFTKEGGVTLDITQENLSDQISSIRFSIQDTGIGIPKDKQKIIFEKFAQASTNTTREFGGTGLGLAITKRLLEIQGSEINLISEENVGTEFYFTINYPVAKQKAVKVTLNYEKRNTEDLSGVHVLLAEDNPLNVFLATKFLEKWDVTVDVAENGKIALEKAQNNDYDLILMDLQMPVMDGAQAAKAIRMLANTQRAQVPILALTASAMLDEQNRLYESGINEYVSKPFNPGDLYGKIKKYAKDKTAA